VGAEKCIVVMTVLLIGIDNKAVGPYINDSMTFFTVGVFDIIRHFDTFCRIDLNVNLM